MLPNWQSIELIVVGFGLNARKSLKRISLTEQY